MVKFNFIIILISVELFGKRRIGGWVMVKRSKKSPCLFGHVLQEMMDKRGLNAYDIERRYGISAVTIHRFMSCQRFPSPFKESRGVSVVDLAKHLGLTKEEKYRLYSALVDTFYPELSKHFMEIKEEKITDDYIKQLVNKKPKGLTWNDIYTFVTEPFVRKVRNLRTDISLFNNRDRLKDLLRHLDLTEKQKAEVLYYFLKKKGADKEFLNILKG